MSARAVRLESNAPAKRWRAQMLPEGCDFEAWTAGGLLYLTATDCRGIVAYERVNDVSIVGRIAVRVAAKAWRLRAQEALTANCSGAC